MDQKIKILSVFFVIGTLVYVVTGLTVCRPHVGFCTGNSCDTESKCENGTCQQDGSCLCNPCYTGKTCGQADDKHYPYFLKDEETIFIDASHQGLVYQAAAVDDDKFKTCVPGSSFPCPCGRVYYELISDFGEEAVSQFEISDETGDISVKKGARLKGGEVYKIDVAASNYNENGDYESNVLSIDILKLKINVQESNSLEAFLRESELQDIEKEKYSQQANMFLGGDDHDDDTLERYKRSAIGTRKEDTNLSLAIVAGGVGTLYPGNSTDFELTIILPNVTAGAPMDFRVELYVMDTISGITTLALCNPRVKSISNANNYIKKAGGAELTIPDVKVSKTANDFLKSIYDRAILDFGDIYNDDTVGGTDYTGSTIVVAFTAIMIPNSQYTNTTAIVTAGAEYSAEQYVWVSQALMDFSNTASTFGANVTARGPDTIPVLGGAQFDIIAYLTNPFETVEVEIFTPSNIHDTFSVTSIQVKSKGVNHACVVPKDSIVFYESVSKRTYHRAVLTFDILVKDGKAGPVVDPANKVEISFTIMAYNATATQILEIGAGLLIGTTTIWTAHSTIVVDSTAVTVAAATTMTGYKLDTRGTPSTPLISVGQSATYGLKITLAAAPQATDVSCKTTASGGNKICGVIYGRSGKYAASFPNLLKKVVYNIDGTALWTVQILNGVSHPTDQTRDTTEEYVTFEVSVIFKTFTADSVTVTCAGVTYPMNAYLGNNGTEDISGTAIQLGNDTNWYAGSQAGLIAELYFPPNGIPYTKTVLETSGDFFQVNYGSRICAIDVLRIGRGAACMARISSQLDLYSIYKKALNSSTFLDSVEIDFGEMCGSYLDDQRTGDNNYTIRIVYDMPLGQPGLTGLTTFNLSIGMLFDDTMIWTGWSSYKVSVQDPLTLPAPSPLPYFFTFPQKNSAFLQDFEQFQPFTTRAIIKGHPGSIASYRIKAYTTNAAIIHICRIVILNLGRNYACIDQFPYGKNLDPMQSVKIVHEPITWVGYAELSLGIVRNLGMKNIYTAPIADQDAIEIGIVARGVALGAANVTVEYYDGRTGAPLIESHMYNIISPVEVVTGSITINVTGIDGTMDYYVDVMKQVEVRVIVPEGYNRYGRIEIVNEAPLTTTLCYAGVAWAGTNVPCIIPHLIIPNVTIDPATGFEIVILDLGRICFTKSSENQTESIVKIRAGFMPDSTLSSSNFKVKYYEGAGSTNVLLTQAYTITKSASPFDPGNISLAGVNVLPVDNSTTASTVEPGLEMWFGIYVSLPAFITVPAELGVMTTSKLGQATATVHGFRWGPTQGMNIGCIQNLSMYTYELFQNASQDSVPMYHASQTDTLVANLKYLTNTGLSYLQMNPQPGDDLAMIEVHILIADHEGLKNGEILTISFSIKVGPAIVVYEKNYTYAKPAADNVMVLETEFNFTDSLATQQDIYTTGQKINVTGRMRHIWNVSHIEAYDARVRVIVPSYIKFANTTMPLVPTASVDTQSINITSNFTSLDIIEFDIGFLFFTDSIEFNLTLSVDPDSSSQMPKGLGLLEGTILMRLVCRESNMTNPAQYCAKTKFLNYYVQGTDCFDDLTVNTSQPCQFHASTSIDSTTLPENAASLTAGSVWSPAVRDSGIFDHFIDIDFLRKTRITKITFSKDGTMRAVTKFSLQTSYDGVSFFNACPNNTMPSGDLRPECRTETRYARVIIKETDYPNETLAIGVKFKWYGCFMETAVGVCTFPATTLTTNTTAWRHVALDTALNIIYFCDYSPVKKRMVCYSSTDGATWNALPTYIASLAGYDAATKKMYAWDSKKRALVGSADGVNWALVDSAVQASLAPTAPTNLPGKAAASFAAVTMGSWTADFYGLKTGGALKVKWNTCCG